MESSPTRVLVVANKTAATPALVDAVRERAAKGPCTFTLLVPNIAHGLHKVVEKWPVQEVRDDNGIESKVGKGPWVAFDISLDKPQTS